MRIHEPYFRSSRKLARGIVLVMAACLVSMDAAAVDPDPPKRPDFSPPSMSSKWKLTLGGSLVFFDTQAAWAPRGLAGTVIELEDTLGLEEHIGTFNVSALYRVNRRHSLELAITDMDRSATRVIDEDIEWGDYVFRADGVVMSDFGVRVYKLSWRYNFSDADRLQAGFLAGLSTFDISVSLRGEGRLQSDDGEESIEQVVESADVIAPVPVVGFFLDYGLKPRLVLHFRANVLDLSISSRHGRVIESAFGIEYAVTDRFGIGAGFGGTDIEYNSDKDDEKLGLRFRFNNVGVFASFMF